MFTTTETFAVPADKMTAAATLPTDWQEATLIGRVMTKDGPSVVFVREDGKVVDITKSYPTTTDLFEEEDPAAQARRAALTGQVIGNVDDIIANSSVRDPNKPYMLAPTDYQEIHAAGVTFTKSMIERIIEEAATLKATGPDGKIDDAKLDTLRDEINAQVQAIVGEGKKFSDVKPGSPEAIRILQEMLKQGISKHYPQVGLGEEGEEFCKAVTAVGHGAQAGYTTPKEGIDSWVNPEPEVVLVANSKGKIVGAAAGNDGNDRDKEGRSLAYLYRAKVVNGSTVIGPFIRVFDKDFNLDSIRNTEVSLKVTRQDGSVKFEGKNRMGEMTREPKDIVAAAFDAERQHPEGLAIFLGTSIIPEKDDRGNKFTHEPGDIVTIGTPELGHFTNVMLPANRVQGLEQGPLARARNLAQRNLLLQETLQKTTSYAENWGSKRGDDLAVHLL